MDFKTTESTAEDAGTAEGWSIGNRLQGYTVSSGLWSPSQNFRVIPQMVIRGEEADASTDATLSALALFDYNSDAVTLSPAFAAAVTSYTAAVANAHINGELEATPNDSNATVEFLDENDATITTVTQTGNVHSILPDFDIGENVFKVKVTAGDGTTTRTYTVTVTRQAAVPNRAPTGQPTISGTPQVDQTLTASTSGIDDADGLTDRVFSYQWVRVDGVDEADITGATSQTYLLTNDEQGLKIKVVVSFVDDRGTGGERLQHGVPGLGQHPAQVQQPAHGQSHHHRPGRGGAQPHRRDVGNRRHRRPETLPGFTYQWQRQDGGVFTDITGADSLVYTLTSEDEGKRGPGRGDLHRRRRQPPFADQRVHGNGPGADQHTVRQGRGVAGRNGLHGRRGRHPSRSPSPSRRRPGTST